jgi:hypothetical protein
LKVAAVAGTAQNEIEYLKESAFMIHVVAIITAKPGQCDLVLEAFRANVPAVHAEEGCIEYGAVVDARVLTASRRSSARTLSS